jgi:hypothetical protein
LRRSADPESAYLRLRLVVSPEALTVPVSGALVRRVTRTETLRVCSPGISYSCVFLLKEIDGLATNEQVERHFDFFFALISRHTVEFVEHNSQSLNTIATANFSVGRARVARIYVLEVRG